MYKKHIFENSQAVAEAFAAYLCEQIKGKDSFSIALSGGSTPKLLFEHLATEYADKIDWSKVHLFWGDERCVPPTDEQSNYKMTWDKLIQFIAIPPENIHRILGENNPKEEAIRYSEVIQQSLPQEDSWPVFDLIILGMGTDGHTASIFPHEIHLLDYNANCAVANHPESGQQRISLTGSVLNRAKQVHFLVPGASKKAVLDEIFNQSGDYLNYPAAYIQLAEWWFDQE